MRDPEFEYRILSGIPACQLWIAHRISGESDFDGVRRHRLLPKVFLSHIAEDESLAKAMKSEFERAVDGFHVFVGEIDIKLGEDWPNELKKGLDDSVGIVCTANQAKWPQKPGGSIFDGLHGTLEERLGEKWTLNYICDSQELRSNRISKCRGLVIHIPHSRFHIQQINA